MTQEIAALYQDIDALLDEPLERACLARLEDTLTVGYARALALEAERHRLERQLAELAEGAEDVERAEIVSAARRLSDADAELTRLRSVLSTLRERMNDARAA